ncbi:hypothetical protein HHL24_40895 [Paraburkholderia sp. RP-4-7]|jgi:hypothetical protein|uniref:Uncharacterized protein n=1 Tax=Paraburkholderia polaris TaxID=2728848 RepID=A0A848IR53_9BURK|nr:hypothetical protein [Paraburkholderia polaris]NMM04201.1 hypothetical protein [Paraburkholderia polaris]
MLEMPEHVPLEHFVALQVWVCAWYDEAVKAEFIGLSYHPDAETVDLLRHYFKVGMAPAEAAHACFGYKH